MQRSRDWRRHNQKVKTKRRLIRLLRRYYWFIDANDIRINRPQWHDFIGTEVEFIFKTLSTTQYDSRYKTKWGKKGMKYYSSDYFTRAKDKERFKKELKLDESF